MTLSYDALVAEIRKYNDAPPDQWREAAANLCSQFEGKSFGRAVVEAFGLAEGSFVTLRWTITGDMYDDALLPQFKRFEPLRILSIRERSIYKGDGVIVDVFLEVPDDLGLQKVNINPKVLKVDDEPA